MFINSQLGGQYIECLEFSKEYPLKVPWSYFVSFPTGQRHFISNQFLANLDQNVCIHKYTQIFLPEHSAFSKAFNGHLYFWIGYAKVLIVVVLVL